MPGGKQTLGRWGEELAAKYLESLGYILVDQNVRTPHGEIDLIVQEEKLPEGCIVFVEVKTRRTELFGLPEYAVDRKKQAHLLAAAAYYIQQYPDLSNKWRIDVISIEVFKDGKPPRITHFENALSG